MSLATPRFATKRGDFQSYGQEIAEYMRLRLGLTPLKWQQDFLDVAMEYRDDGTPVHDVAAVLSVCRQSGKSYVVKAIMGWWAERWPNQRILYVAQARQDARAQILDFGADILRGGAPCQVYRGMPERIEFQNGSQINVAAPKHTAVHGSSLDLVLLDEAWISMSPEILQAVVPARAARPLSMMVCLTTMGTESSDTWNELRDRGRDQEPGVAYVEYSMDTDTQDLLDDEQWWSWMPALGGPITKASVWAGMKMLTSPAEQRRAYGNVTTSVEHDMFNLADWMELLDAYEMPAKGDLVLSVAANPYFPGGAAIAAAWQKADDSWHVSIADYQPGASTLWLIPRVEELVKEMKPTAITVGQSVATKAVRPELEALAEAYVIPFRTLSAGELASASVLWADSVTDGAMTHGESAGLDQATEYAVPKPTEEGWRLDLKRMKVDGSPLAAAIPALYVAQEERASRPSVGVF